MKLVCNLTHRLKKFHNFRNYNKGAVFIAIFATIAVITLISSYAATPTANFEAESSSLTSCANNIADAGASGGQAVKFGCPTSITYTVPVAITSDCSVEVSTEINNWLASVPNGSTIYFKVGACYRVDNTITLTSRNNLTIDGLGADFKTMSDGRETSNPTTRFHFNINTSNNVTIKNYNVHGINPNTGTAGAYVAELEGQHGFNIWSSHDITLDNVQVNKVYGDFVYTGRQSGSVPYNITIKNSEFDGSGRQGIAPTAIDNIIIENNVIARAGRATIDLEPNTSTWTIKNVFIRNNKIIAGRLLFVANAGACAEISNIVIENNTLTSSKNMDIWSFPPSGCTIVRGPYRITGNVSDSQSGNTGMHTMRFVGANDVTISNNTQPMQAGRDMRLVKLENVSNARVENNRTINAFSTILLSSGVTNYCYDSNFIGNPLVIEPSTVPCI